MLDIDVLLKKRIKLEGDSAIFFLFNDDEIVYIGKSSQFNIALGQHIDTKRFDSFTIISVDRENLDDLLFKYLHKFKPRYGNPVLNTSEDYLSRSKITQKISGHLFNFILRYFDIDTIGYSGRTTYRKEDLIEALKICKDYGVAVKPDKNGKVQYNSSAASNLRKKLIKK